MSRGKEICKVLKDVRRRIAEENGIAMDIPECTFKGECRGTCPRCEAELRYLDSQLCDRRRSGRAVKIAGIAAGALALLSPLMLSATTTSSPGLDKKNVVKENEVVTMALVGSVSPPEEPKSIKEVKIKELKAGVGLTVLDDSGNPISTRNVRRSLLLSLTDEHGLPVVDGKKWLYYYDIKALDSGVLPYDALLAIYESNNIDLSKFDKPLIANLSIANREEKVVKEPFEFRIEIPLGVIKEYLNKKK